MKLMVLDIMIAAYRASLSKSTRCRDTFDVVGSACESADFLGKERKLPMPERVTFISQSSDINVTLVLRIYCF